MLQERRERAEPAQSNRPFAQKPIARETVSRKESSVVTDAGKAQAADLVGRVADWPVLNAEEKLTAMRDLASRTEALAQSALTSSKVVRRSFLESGLWMPKSCMSVKLPGWMKIDKGSRLLEKRANC